MLDQFNLQIEKMAKQNNSYIDAVLEFIENSEGTYDFDDIQEILHPFIIEKIKIEFIEKNYLKDKKIQNSLKDFI